MATITFADFLNKLQITGNLFVVGYDADTNEEIRMPMSAIISASDNNQNIVAQYSVDGNTWHSNYIAGDKYMRVKVGLADWSDPILLTISAYDIWLSQGNTGSEADFLESLKCKPETMTTKINTGISTGGTITLCQVLNQVDSSKLAVASQQQNAVLKLF